MAINISFGIQKGGVGKTTTTAITAYLLSQKARVLAVDFDSQGNLSQFLSQRNIYEFTDNTVLEAIKGKNPVPYIHQVADRLDLLPAEDFLAGLSQYLYRQYNGNPVTLLKETLDRVQSNYDYILIDLPPNLGEQTMNGLVASDFAVVMLQSEPFCYDALDRYLEFLEAIQKQHNPSLRLAGILTSMMDVRTTIDTSILEQARKDYEEVVFKSVIRRRSRIKEFSLEGIKDKTRSDLEALRPYRAFVKELIARVQKG